MTSVLAVLAVILCVGGIVAWTSAGPDSVIPSTAATASGELYFTTTRPAAVNDVTYSFHAEHLQLTGSKTIARLPGADGVLFGPNGGLLVGGVRTGNVYSVDPSTGAVQATGAGVPAAMHLALSPDRKTLYTSGEPGALAALSSDLTQTGHEIVLRGSTSVVTALAFGPNNQVLYTKSAPQGKGDIGEINLATGATRSLFRNIVGAHGILYDPFSGAYLVVGSDVVLQIASTDLSRIESEAVLPGNRFDQGAVTGRGQLLIASNFGSLVLIDYSRSGRVGDVTNVVIQKHLATNLDDVAPLTGPGARPIATNAGLHRLVGGIALAVGVVIAGGFALSFLERRRREERSRDRQLPRWDRRRRTNMDNPFA